MRLRKYKYMMWHLLIFSGCLLLQLALRPVESNGKQAAGRTASSSAASGTIDTVNPFRQDIVRAAETGPFTFMFRLADNMRSFMRLPARNTHQGFSFENVVLLYSVHKKSLHRIFIRRHASSTSLFRCSSCRYYVFALREILV